MAEEKKDRYKQWETGNGYDRYITAELNSFRKNAWKKQIIQHLKKERGLKILDIGTGPGFFACILSEEGYDVTGIDQSEGMLEKARKNADKLHVTPTFYRMDVNHLTFPDESFDVIVTRNVTWTLEHPEEIYLEFRRVLKPGGLLLIYDANWHMHFFDEELLRKVRAREKAYLEKYGRVEIVADNDPDFFRTAPLTSTMRPAWDQEILQNMGMEVSISEDIGRFVYEEWEKELYAESPLFEICAVKPEPGGSHAEDNPLPWEKQDTNKIRVLDGLQAYWGERSTSYSTQNVEEMEDFRREAWRNLILEKEPEGESRNILDVGCGPGFFAINLALAGCRTTGVDITKEMLECAKQNAAAYEADVKFSLYDGKLLPFEEGMFDMVISRNVLWNVEDPELALSEWQRVLRPGGHMVYFDANWYLYLFDETQWVRHEEAHRKGQELFPEYHHDPMGVEKGMFLEKLAERLPLSRVYRPEWDRETLIRLGMEVVSIDSDITDCIYSEYEKVHNAASPMFRVCARKRQI